MKFSRIMFLALSLASVLGYAYSMEETTSSDDVTFAEEETTEVTPVPADVTAVETPAADVPAAEENPAEEVEPAPSEEAPAAEENPATTASEEAAPAEDNAKEDADMDDFFKDLMLDETESEK